MSPFAPRKKRYFRGAKGDYRVSMMLLQRLLDRISLRPSRHVIEHDLQTTWLDVDGCRCEVFQLDVEAAQSDGPIHDVNIVKFVGSGGRAENLTPLTLGGLKNVRAKIWVANPPGYGRSQGPATLTSQIQTARRLYQYVKNETGSAPILAGDSLGGAIAICLASEVATPGLIVRDPPPIRQLILKRYRFFKRIAAYFAGLVPDEVDAMAAAARCNVPAIFVSSRLDRIVPVECQDELMAAYGGPMRKVIARDAFHCGPLTVEELAEYRSSLEWLLQF